MAIAFITQSAKDKAKKLGLSDNVRELVSNCASRTFKEAFQLFKIRHPYLYKRIGNARLIAKVESVGDLRVICILDILLKGDRESSEFNADHERFGKEKLEKLLDRHILETFVESELVKGADFEGVKKDSLPEGLMHWLEPFERIRGTDELILESHKWVKKFESKEYEKFWQSYYQIVNRLVGVDVDAPVRGGSRIYSLGDHKGRSILYTRFLLQEPHAGSESVIFLLDPKGGGETAPADGITPDFGWVDVKPEILDSIDEIAPHASRSYLSLVLADENLWYQTEMSDAANPALSAEELTLLSRVRHAPVNEPVLPIFINGRAGSGKSTMLYHLFSDYLHRKAARELEGELLFLTYSDSLLKTARENVRKLMRARTDFQFVGPASDLESKLPKFEAYFRPFLGFVRDHVPTEILVQDFPADKQMDFSAFKTFFSRYAPGKRISADLCWHVIRTFIKGHSLEDFLSPDDYDDLPQKEKSVTTETFGQVYKTVWERYRESGYWDTQDLVRRILQEGWTYPKYTVVFCDEAQDFTRLELDFILRLLAYQEYDLGWTKYVRLPFAMAGDPFQTLNPTGFRWEAIKASFYDEIVGNLDPFRRENIVFDYKELAYNYRSQAPIVRLSNLFQLWREIYFGNTEVLPQKPWRDDEYIIPPRLYVMNENISEDEFLTMARDSVVILPCEYGQEGEYVQSDPLLLKLWGNEAYPTLLQSPMAAKGLEYTEVILYGFGDACPEKFFDTPSGDALIEHEYFLNKLYVAATRAMKSLIIVDTKLGKERLWKHTLGETAVKGSFDKAKSPQKWEKSRVDGVTSGDYYEPDKHVAKNPLELAQKLEEAGQGNPGLLRQAMDFYRRAGEESKAHRCEAKALEAEGKYKSAGDSFSAQGRHDDAERCYWKGECWAELNLWYIAHSGGDPSHEIIAALMLAIGYDQAVVSNFIDQIMELNSRNNLILLEEPQFHHAAAKVAKLLGNEDHTGTEVLRKFVSLVKALPVLQHVIGLEQCALLLFRAAEFERAIDLWEKVGKKETDEYRRAKAVVTQDPNEKIHWYSLLGSHNSITGVYEKMEGATLDNRAIKMVAEAYRALGDVEKSFRLTWQTGDYGKALSSSVQLLQHLTADASQSLFDDYYRALLSKNQLDIAADMYRSFEGVLESAKRVEYVAMYVARLVRVNRWSEAVPLVGQGKSKKSMRLPTDGPLGAHRLIIGEIGSSEKIVEASAAEKTALHKYLKQCGRFSEWSSLIPVPTMSAAVEKTGTFVEALEFYEALEKEKLTPEQAMFVRQRWLKVKSKQLERLQGEMQSGHSRASTGYARNWTARKKEMDERMQMWRVGMNDINRLSEYPSVQRDRDLENYSDIQIEWRSPVCQIAIGNEVNILVNVLEGSLIAFPSDIVTSQVEGERIIFNSERLRLSGEVAPRKLIRVFVNGKLEREYSLG